jgi:hypothetical protein
MVATAAMFAAIHFDVSYLRPCHARAPEHPLILLDSSFLIVDSK